MKQKGRIARKSILLPHSVDQKLFTIELSQKILRLTVNTSKRAKGSHGMVSEAFVAPLAPIYIPLAPLRSTIGAKCLIHHSM